MTREKDQPELVVDLGCRRIRAAEMMFLERRAFLLSPERVEQRVVRDAQQPSFEIGAFRAGIPARQCFEPGVLYSSLDQSQVLNAVAAHERGADAAVSCAKTALERETADVKRLQGVRPPR